MSEDLELHIAHTEEEKTRILFDKVSKSILDIETDNLKKISNRYSEKQMVEKIVNIIEREIK